MSVYSDWDLLRWTGPVTGDVTGDWAASWIIRIEGNLETSSQMGKHSPAGSLPQSDECLRLRCGSESRDNGDGGRGLFRGVYPRLDEATEVEKGSLPDIPASFTHLPRPDLRRHLVAASETNRAETNAMFGE
ncbi:hypothetical protein JEQ12_013614 [Ovis aries]|uniref:Uncharacterized protein n=1 Tax=Ovis aries TaxID=9940 RepID=A0A836AIS4_SHEEP|nr:hypothetical protein JEQ12_013614 [Ovis aries]